MAVRILLLKQFLFLYSGYFLINHYIILNHFALVIILFPFYFILLLIQKSADPYNSFLQTEIKSARKEP